MVGDIEEFRAELNAEGLGNLLNPSVLEQRQIQIFEIRTGQIVSLKVAERTHGRYRESCRIGVTVDPPDDGVDARNDVGPLFTAISVSGLIEPEEHIPGRAARVREAAAELPAANEHVASPRKCVDARELQKLRTVKLAAAFVVVARHGIGPGRTAFQTGGAGSIVNAFGP